MERMQIMKVDATANGLWMKFWIDDEEGHHLTVVEHFIPQRALASWVSAVVAEQNRSTQYQLHFDD